MATARRAGLPGALRAWSSEPAVADAWRALWVSRLVVWVAGVAAVVGWGVIAHNAAAFDPGGLTRPFGTAGDDLVAPGARWDAKWFLLIADDGYAPDAPRAAFFPLYPLLVRVTAFVVGSPVIAGIALSVGCLFWALVLLHRLVALDFGRDVARLCLVLVAVFPGALWFSSVYSESLFLLLSVGAVYAARTDRWALAGIAGALAATTRSAGVILLVPLAVLWWRSARRPADLAWTLLVPLGVVAFCAYIAAATPYGFLQPFDAQAAWLRSFAGPFSAVPKGIDAGVTGIGDLLAGTPRPTTPFDPARANAEQLAALVAVIVALAGALRRLPLAYGLYALAALALPLSYPVEGQPLMSLPRFAAVLWPLHLWLAVVLVRRPWPRRAVVGLSVILLAMTSFAVARWAWIA